MAKRTRVTTVRRGSFLNRYSRTYHVVDKDPAIDKIRTLLEDEHCDIKDAAILSNVGRTTIDNWLNGDTKRPQHATLAAVASGLGYTWELKRERKIDVESELPKAVKWNLSYREMMEETKGKKNGKG